MPSSFYRVSSSLRADRSLKSSLGLMVAFTLLTSWTVWACKSRIAQLETSDLARLEVDSATYPIQASVSGRLVFSRLLLGQQVHAGDILAEVDSQDETLSLLEERTKLAAMGPQIAALEAQIKSEDEGKVDERRVLSVSVDGAKAQYNEAEALALSAERDAQRAGLLHSEGIMAEADAQRAKAESVSKRAAADNLKLSISRLEPELQVRESDRSVKRNGELADLAKLNADSATSSATVKRLAYEIERRRIRAATSGRLAECAALRIGAQISEGQQLGVILPHGNLLVVAEYQPSAAFGKIHPGQTGTLRLQGFPWAQYGTVPLTVTRVAAEIRDNLVRVELAMDPGSQHSRIPFQHGLPGSVEIQVDRISPVAMLLRSLGGLAGAH